MAKWYRQAAEIEQLRRENEYLHRQVAELKIQLQTLNPNQAPSQTQTQSRNVYYPPQPSALNDYQTEPARPQPIDNFGITADERALINQGKKIEAIKNYRERTGAGLREAKDAIDRAEEGYKGGTAWQ
ncbi:MAG: ribosomal protein L7/L12 [Arcanobacterium sp.]